MIRTEYVRSLQSNYARILLAEKPQENRYQYCIMSRGNVKGLLPCSLRYIDGLAYLYYDITSKQSVAQLYGRKRISREWLKDFMWSMEKVRQELSRFLLSDRNIIWLPEQVYQDLEKNNFSFLYVPYYEEEQGFIRMLDFWIENIDYEDEALVECVYKIYEKYEQNGEVYFQKGIFEDLEMLNAPPEKEAPVEDKWEEEKEENGNDWLKEDASPEMTEKMEEKKGIRYFLEGRKRKNREQRESYRQVMEQQMSGLAVAEETVYEQEEYGKTIYIEETAVEQKRVHRLMTLEGELLAWLDRDTLLIGKKKDEADLVLDSTSVSRIHARIIRDEDGIYIEDLNSTNGTFCNGLPMRPYEKRKLEEGDELKIGKVITLFR